MLAGVTIVDNDDVTVIIRNNNNVTLTVTGAVMAHQTLQPSLSILGLQAPKENPGWKGQN